MVFAGFSDGSINLISSHNSSKILLTVAAVVGHTLNRYSLAICLSILGQALNHEYREIDRLLSRLSAVRLRRPRTELNPYTRLIPNCIRTIMITTRSVRIFSYYQRAYDWQEFYDEIDIEFDTESDDAY
jgi:hypothetical protein